MSREWLVPFTSIHLSRYLLLVCSIMLLFVLLPFFEGHTGMVFLLDAAMSAVFISGIYAVSQNRTLFLTGLVIGVLGLATRWGKDLVESRGFDLTAGILGLLFFSFAAIVILIDIFKEDEVTLDIISGAICVYLLMGLIWAFAFSIMEDMVPGSFHMTTGVGTSAKLHRFIYYSFVTQTTLGYGDITPVTMAARSSSIVEATLGQLYIAVLIARLVGMHISQSIQKKKSP